MTRPNDEEGITNLGRVPAGLTFAEATERVAVQRKYQIDPYAGGHRLTLCDTLRHTWRLVDGLPNDPDKEQIRDYLRAAFDYAKRMDARMKELKGLAEQC